MLKRLMPRRAVALHLAAMAAVLGTAVGLLAQGTQPAHAELMPQSGLLVSTRDHFRMCVDTTSEVRDAAQARTDLAAAVAGVQHHPDWKRAFGAPPAEARATVAPTCPDVRFPDHIDRMTMVGPGITDAPSQYRTWVHILDERTADRLLGEDVPALTVTAEAMRDGEHQVAAVSTAVLVRRSRLDDDAFRQTTLPRGIGLLPQHAPVSAGPHTVKGGQ